MDLGGRAVGTEAVVIDDESFGKGHWAWWGLIWERLSIEGVKHRAVETCLHVDKRVKSKMTQGFLVWVTQIMAGLLTGREGTDLRTNIFTSVVDRFRHAQYTFRGLWFSKQLEVFPVRLVFVWKLAGELVFVEYFLCSQLYLWSVLQSEVLKNMLSHATDLQTSLISWITIRKKVFYGKFHGQRSLVVYSPWSYKGSDTSEHTAHTHRQLCWGWQSEQHTVSALEDVQPRGEGKVSHIVLYSLLSFLLCIDDEWYHCPAERWRSVT